MDNLVVTCAPCNFGRMSYTLEEVGLVDPRLRQPVRSAWDGLERFNRQSNAHFGGNGSRAEKVLAVAAEGGGVVIYRARHSGQWFFRLATDDQTPALIGEEPLNRVSGWAPTLQDAIKGISWPWHRFSPLKIHPEYGAEVLALKRAMDQARGANERYILEWEAACGLVGDR